MRYVLHIVLTALALLLAGARVRAEEPARLELDGPPRSENLTRVDVDGDGILDLVMAQGRDVWVWSGEKGKLPGAKATWSLELPGSVSFIDFRAVRPGEPSVLTLGTDGLLRIGLAAPGIDAGKTTLNERGIDWSDPNRATFGYMQDGHDGLLLPTVGGWRFESKGGETISLRIQPERRVSAPGPFLEDTAAVRSARPRVFVGRCAVAGHAGAALWAFDGSALHAQGAKQRVTYDLAWLPTDGDRRLVDLDNDGLPEVIHRKMSTSEGTYGFFRTRPAAKSADATLGGPSHKPALSFLRLSGFQMEPDLIDVNGDGLLDFVITTIDIDGKNTLRALTTRLVTAQTRAFLNRGASHADGYFASVADQTVTSEVGVRIVFTYAGAIDVKRSFTILVEGDYDGDGRADLAIRTADGALLIRRGIAKGVWAAEGVRVPIPPVGDHINVDGYAVDLDGDRRDEVLLVYRSAPGKPEKIWLVSPRL